jgi:glycosyltransferase involved in cell wall biosynthesis
MLDYDENELQKLLQAIGRPELRTNIHLLGYVLNTELPAIISQCTIFLYPSLRESFGIPILEGMACGVPVITSNTSSMPEVAGKDAALIVDPFNSDEITVAMQTLVKDRLLSKVLAEKGIQRAQKFSWVSMSQNVLELYKEVYQEINKPVL